MVGSLPLGGSVEKTPIYCVCPIPFQLAPQHDEITCVSKRSVELEGIDAFIIDNIINNTDTSRMIELCEGLGFRKEAPGIRTPPGMRFAKV